MKTQICQSCGMPITSDEQLGTNKDGSINNDYCNRYDIDVAQEHLTHILKNYKKLHKDFKYILITEKHKDGAFHFHGLMKRFG